MHQLSPLIPEIMTGQVTRLCGPAGSSKTSDMIEVAADIAKAGKFTMMFASPAERLFCLNKYHELGGAEGHLLIAEGSAFYAAGNPGRPKWVPAKDFGLIVVDVQPATVDMDRIERELARIVKAHDVAAVLIVTTQVSSGRACEVVNP